MTRQEKIEYLKSIASGKPIDGGHPDLRIWERDDYDNELYRCEKLGLICRKSDIPTGRNIDNIVGYATGRFASCEEDIDMTPWDPTKQVYLFD